MKIVDSIQRMSTLSKITKKEGKSTGLVPTMGYLHDGHLSLVRASKKHNDVTVMSVFVNPIQFGPREDLATYPRDFKRDEEMARAAAVDIFFCPTIQEMYPQGYATYVDVERLTEGLCGERRLGHFRGVATVVAKLFGIVRPDIAYFGQKDAQQAAVIRSMARDLNMGVEIKVTPIVREKDGLAMSSRNIYLSEAERKDAAVLYESLKVAEGLAEKGERNAKRIIKMMEETIAGKKSVKIDYISIVDAETLKSVDAISSEALVALAAHVGHTRLIDNTIIRTTR